METWGKKENAKTPPKVRHRQVRKLQGVRQGKVTIIENSKHIIYSLRHLFRDGGSTTVGIPLQRSKNLNSEQSRIPHSRSSLLPGYQGQQEATIKGGRGMEPDAMGREAVQLIRTLATTGTFHPRAALQACPHAEAPQPQPDR